MKKVDHLQVAIAKFATTTQFTQSHDRFLNTVLKEVSLRSQNVTLNNKRGQNIKTSLGLIVQPVAAQLERAAIVQPLAGQIVQFETAQFSNFLGLTTLSNHFEILNAVSGLI